MSINQQHSRKTVGKYWGKSQGLFCEDHSSCLPSGKPLAKTNMALSGKPWLPNPAPNSIRLTETWFCPPTHVRRKKNRQWNVTKCLTPEMQPCQGNYFILICALHMSVWLNLMRSEQLCTCVAEVYKKIRKQLCYRLIIIVYNWDLVIKHIFCFLYVLFH